MSDEIDDYESALVRIAELEAAQAPSDSALARLEQTWRERVQTHDRISAATQEAPLRAIHRHIASVTEGCEFMALATINTWNREAFLHSVKPFKFTELGAIERKRKADVVKEIRAGQRDIKANGAAREKSWKKAAKKGKGR